MKACLLIGNSRWHWAIYKNKTWIFSHESPIHQKRELLEFPLVAWGAVGEIPKNIHLDPDKEIKLKNIPLKNLPPWLGIDRGLAAFSAFKQANEAGTFLDGILVADAGTILSLTRISSKGEFAGGQLTPGLNLQIESMAYGAKNLHNPGARNNELPLFPIKTNEAMHRGSIQALAGVIVEAILETKMPLWLCGGDAPLIIKALEKRNLTIIHQPNLVLEGMIEIQKQINQFQDPK